MSYVKTEWQTGDLITADKINKIEDGIEVLSEGYEELKSDISNIEETGGCQYYSNKYLDENGDIKNGDGHTVGIIGNIHKGNTLRLTANTSGYWGTLFGIKKDGSSVKLLNSNRSYENYIININDSDIVEVRAWSIDNSVELNFEKISLFDKIQEYKNDISENKNAIKIIDENLTNVNDVLYPYELEATLNKDDSEIVNGRVYDSEYYKADNNYLVMYFPVVSGDKYRIHTFSWTSSRTIIVLKTKENDGSGYVFNPNEPTTSDMREVSENVTVPIGYNYIAVCVPNGQENNTTVKHYSHSTESVIEMLSPRKKIYIGIGKDYEKFSDGIINAYAITNCDVYISSGEYDILNEIDINSIITDDQLKWGLPIGNGCRYYFENGATVKCNYTGDNETINSIFSLLTANSKNFEIHGGHLEGSNIRYVVHDETAGVGTYAHEYHNVSMKLDNTNNTHWTSKMCIGGGLGEYATIIVDGGVYDSVGSTSDNFGGISYHNPDSGNGSDFKNLVVVKNVYFDEGSVTVIPLGDSTKISEFYCSNCSLQFPPNVQGGNNFVLKQWNNEIRTN